MAKEQEVTPNSIHKADTSFKGGLTCITDDPGLPLDGPEAQERQRKRQEQIARKEEADKKSPSKDDE